MINPSNLARSRGKGTLAVLSLALLTLGGAAAEVPGNTLKVYTISGDLAEGMIWEEHIPFESEPMKVPRNAVTVSARGVTYYRWSSYDRSSYSTNVRGPLLRGKFDEWPPKNWPGVSMPNLHEKPDYDPRKPRIIGQGTTRPTNSYAILAGRSHKWVQAASPPDNTISLSEGPDDEEWNKAELIKRLPVRIDGKLGRWDPSRNGAWIYKNDLRGIEFVRAGRTEFLVATRTRSIGRPTKGSEKPQPRQDPAPEEKVDTKPNNPIGGLFGFNDKKLREQAPGHYRFLKDTKDGPYSSGRITLEANGKYRWTTKSGVAWDMTGDPAAKTLTLPSDHFYFNHYKDGAGKAFQLDVKGGKVKGFTHQYTYYTRVED
ncbi:MAG: hypothetical protein ACI8UO_005762 [Verrucomicrobiales bacterium]|jgi:hypothetical protein